MPQREGLPRREFAKHCLGGLGIAALAAPAAAADETDDAAAKPPAELLILSALLQQYPSEHYTEEIVAGLYRDVAGDLARGKQLRAFPLQNSHEPACTFRVFRAAGAS